MVWPAVSLVLLLSVFPLAFSLWVLFVEYDFAWDIGVSIFRVWTAFLISAAMAIPLGILMSSYRIVNGISEPVIDFIVTARGRAYRALARSCHNLADALRNAARALDAAA